MDPSVQAAILTAAGGVLTDAGTLIGAVDPSMQTQIAPSLHTMATCVSDLVNQALPGVTPTAAKSNREEQPAHARR